MKLSKRILILLLCTAVLASVCATAVAEEVAPERTIVYAQVPDDWQYPCLWAWADDGTSAFASWPGEQMEPDPANAGWYYAYMPTGMDAVIVNANDGGVQTSDYRIDKQNAWITVTSAEEVTVSFEAQTTGEAPAYTERFTVYAQVDPSWENPGTWAWEDPSGKNAFAAWPGRAMKPNENGWYSARVPVFVNSVIINANNGGVQTADIKELDPADVWITVAADGSYDFTYEDPDMLKAEDITVYAKAPEGWEAPCLWAWSHPDGTNAFQSWPGEPLTFGEDGWYSITVPGWINSVILNANAGTVQTSDLSVEVGRDIYLVVKAADDAVIAYEEPAE
ncbi:MAG: starch-binding protein [Firmicutes bacterium]|nr:starch-binding protein [Bacillota bacterium]